jgi:hypothetical protein
MSYGPIPPQRRADERIQSWVRTVVVPLVGFALLVYGGSAFLTELRTPPVKSATPDMASVAPLSPPLTAMSSPIAIRFPDTLVLVTHTPVPTTPRPTVAIATPVINLCGPWLGKDEVCTMPEFTPTPQPPLPECPTVEDAECVWTGRPGADVPIGTAKPELSSYYGGPN